MNEVIVLIALTVFLCGCGFAFNQFVIKPIGKAHYQTVDKAIRSGVLSKNSTREEVKQWIKQYDAMPAESAINDTLNYISQKESMK